MEFSGTLLSDDSIRVANPKFGSDYCKEFRMFKAQAVVPESPLPFDTKGFQYQPFMTMIMQGDFSALGLSADDSRFNELFGAYLYAYAEQCAADPKTRPADFVEMTNLQCVEKGVTKTYYRNGTFSESAPYCTQWKDVPSGYFADPQLWEVKKTLDQRFLDDTYKYMFAAIKGSDLPYRGPRLGDFKKIAEAAALRAQEMRTLIERNGCDAPGLMRFQENLRLYGQNMPFGIRPNGNLEPAVPIPRPGAKYEDPDITAFLEELIKGEARTWQVNKYILQSVAGAQVRARDEAGRPRELTARYGYGGLGGARTAEVRVTFVEGYPECLYFSDHPQTCRSPDKMLVARYVHGYFSPQSLVTAVPAPDASVDEQRQKEREIAAQNRRNRREALR